MKYAFYILYRYNKSARWQHTPFFGTSLLFWAILFLNFFSILLMWGVPKYIAETYNDRNILPVSCCLLYVSIIAVIYIFIKEKDMDRPEYYKRYKSRHGWFMVLFIFFSIALFGRVVISDFNPNYKKKEFPPDEIVFKKIPEIKK